MTSKSPSLRSSERGLKFCSLWLLLGQTVSLRSSERGLKYIYMFVCVSIYLVAPFVGAWIEMM